VEGLIPSAPIQVIRMTSSWQDHSIATAPVAFPGRRAARWAIVLGAIVALGFAGLAVASLTGTPIADDGPWMHLVLALIMLVALAVGMTAFGMAVVAGVQRQRSLLLLLPLLAFPGLVAYLFFSTRF
jgi:hypothetical protein